MRLLHGKALAEKLHDRSRERSAALRARGVAPRLAAVSVGIDPAANTYLQRLAARGGSLGQPGATVALGFALPDGKPPLQVKAVLVRADSEGHLFSFVDLNEAEFRRLVDFCKGLASDRMAMFRLGLAYEFGKGVAQDRSEALRWYQRSAALGLGQAQRRLKALGEER